MKLPKACLNPVMHSPMPSSYRGRSEWADEMMAYGFRQVRCPCCGLYTLWVRPR